MAVNWTTDPWKLNHEDFPRSDWKYEVENDDTHQGYRDWLISRLEAEGREDEIPKTEPIIVEVKDGCVNTIYGIPHGMEIRVEEFGLDDLEAMIEEGESTESLLIPGTPALVRIHNSRGTKESV